MAVPIADDAAAPRRSAAVWDLAVPVAAVAPGVRMAGFRGLAPGTVDLRMVPCPAVTLFIELGDGVLVDGAGAVLRRGGVVGLAPLAVRAVGRDVDCLQIRVSPAIARAVLRDPPEARSGPVGLDEAWGPSASRLRDRLRATRDWDDRFRIAAEAIAGAVESGPQPDPEVRHVWRRMVVAGGGVGIEELATDVGWSRKRLWSRFGAQIGLTPKRAAQLIRFDTAARGLASGRAPARVAFDCGYADQSHLHREVRSFTDLTPGVVAGEPWLDVDALAWPDPRRRNIRPRPAAGSGRSWTHG